MIEITGKNGKSYIIEAVSMCYPNIVFIYDECLSLNFDNSYIIDPKEIALNKLYETIHEYLNVNNFDSSPIISIYTNLINDDDILKLKEVAKKIEDLKIANFVIITHV